MLKDINNLINETENERISEITNDIFISNEKCRKATQEVISAYVSLEKTLSQEFKENLYRYEDAIGLKESLVFKALYKQGIKDGLRIASLYNSLTRNSTK